MSTLSANMVVVTAQARELAGLKQDLADLRTERARRLDLIGLETATAGLCQAIEAAATRLARDVVTQWREATRTLVEKLHQVDRDFQKALDLHPDPRDPPDYPVNLRTGIEATLAEVQSAAARELSAIAHRAAQAPAATTAQAARAVAEWAQTRPLDEARFADAVTRIFESVRVSPPVDPSRPHSDTDRRRRSLDRLNRAGLLLDVALRIAKMHLDMLRTGNEVLTQL